MIMPLSGSNHRGFHPPSMRYDIYDRILAAMKAQNDSPSRMVGSIHSKILSYRMSPCLSFICSISQSHTLTPKNSFSPVYGIGSMYRPGLCALIFVQSLRAVILYVAVPGIAAALLSLLLAGTGPPSAVPSSTNSLKSGLIVVCLFRRRRLLRAAAGGVVK